MNESEMTSYLGWAILVEERRLVVLGRNGVNRDFETMRSARCWIRRQRKLRAQAAAQVVSVR